MGQEKQPSQKEGYMGPKKGGKRMGPVPSKLNLTRGLLEIEVGGSGQEIVRAKWERSSSQNQ